MMARPRHGHHALKARQHDLIEEAPDFGRRLPQADWRADLGAVAAVAGRKFHDDDIPVFKYAAGGTGIAEDHRRILHRGRADNREVNVASSLEDRAGHGGFELIFSRAGPAAPD